MTAQQAYGLLDTGGEGRRNPLTVTKATLGEMTLRTSRGPARVPAWLLTLDGYDTPLKRVAVNPSKLPHAPIEPLTQVTDALMPLEGLQAVAQDDRAITVRAGHGACDDGAAVDVLETSDSVVLASSIRGTNDGACTSQLLTDAVTVRLGRPLGKRVLLDAFTGGPVQYSRQP
jgi:hypothetical protein